MFSSANKTRTNPTINVQHFITLLLAYCLLIQTIAPPALAAPRQSFSFAWLGNSAASLASVFKKPNSAPPAAAAAVPIKQSTEEFGVVLTQLSTAFSGHVGIEHHQPLRKVVVSANNPSGMPLNFESIDEDGTHRPYSNVAGLTGAQKIATARDDGTGMSLGGFNPGELFSGTGVPGVIARVAADGATVQNPWVTLPGETGLESGLFIDRTGVFGGDLIAVTATGGVWRITSAGVASRVADLGTALEGVTTVPNDVPNYGPWAGKILAGAKTQNAIYAIDAQGAFTTSNIGISPQDIRIIPAHENFYGVDPTSSKIWGAPDDTFAGIIGDILIAQGSPGVLLRASWNGTEIELGEIAEVPSWKQITFSSAALSEIAGVKQFYDKIAVVRHAPELNSGRVEGALWQLLPENLALDGTDVITSDLLVPGVPAVTVGSGNPSFDGVIQGVESTQPTGYSISISNNAHLRHVITRTNPISLMPIPAPPAPAGMRDVSLSQEEDTIGDPATLRHLSISGKAGAVVVPPGTYGRFAASGHTAFVLGVEGATVASVYNLEELSLSGGSELRVVGPVKLTVKGNVTLVGSSVGAPEDPLRLTLQVAQGTVSVTGNGVLYAIVRNPQGLVTIPGNGRIRGTVTADRLRIDGNGILQIVFSDVAPPPVNRPPAVDAGPDQTITLPTDSVSLNGAATDDGLPLNGTLTTTWTKVSGPGPVTFAAPGNPVTTATFTEPGIYVLRLTASDSLLTVFDEVTVEVVPRNQPPEVNAGPDQTIELPNTATMAGVVTDDALPRGSTVTRTWSVVNGPGAVTFADVHDLSTVVTFATAGTYTLRLTADDTEFTVSDDLVVTVHPENQPPVVNAGPDQTVRIPTAAVLNGTATDDGFPFGSMLTTTWTKVSGPGTVTFTNASSPVTAAQFSVEGTYVLRLTADDTRFTVSDECAVTVLPQNTPPIVNAGPDQTLTFLQAGTLNGTATDDGLPVGSIVETVWTTVSGPGTVTIANPANLTSGVTFSAPGTYVLRLTGDDTQFTVHDELTITVNPIPHASKVYTLNADFNLGSLINLSLNPADQLQLDETSRSFKFIWVAVSTKGTVVKINTETGQIIGEYFTSPNGQPRDPSRTTVDQNGNVWATNRAGNSVVHIGLVENGQCIDRNGNGVIDTSTGANNIRPWTNTGGANTNGGVSTAQDECILHYTRVNSFGTRHVSVNRDNDIWVSGTSGQRFDLIDGVTGQIKRQENSVGFGGYGGLIDRNNVIWSANPMLRWDTANPLNGPNGVNWRGFSHPSYGLCIDSQGNVYNTSFGNGTIRKFAPNGTLLGSFNQGSPWAQGCVVDRNDHVWIAHSLNTNTVGHMLASGVYIGTITVGSGPTGVAVDGDGKIWATNYNSRTVSRINPALGPIGGDGVTRVGAVEFTTVDLGGNPYNYSDMTGSTLTGAPDTGTWSVVFDSQIAGAQWGRIGWTAQVCGDGLLTMSVATSENNVTYSTPVVVANGDDPVVPNGRFVRITVRFDRASSGESPILYDLSIGTVGFPFQTPTNVAPGIDAGVDQTLNGTLQTALRGSVCDDALPSNTRLTMSWSKVSGPGNVTFSQPSSLISNVTFSTPGTYTLRLTASDSVHTGSDQLVVTVIPGNQAPVVNAGADQTIVLPAVANLNGTATDDGLPLGSTLTTTWSKLSGPGLVTFGNANQLATTAAFSVAGTYVLRLEASDTQKGSFDDVSIVVLPRPNRAPDITSEPSIEFSLGSVPTGSGDLVNLGPWTTKQYELNSQPDASWQKDLPNNAVTQIVNADAAILLSDFNFSNGQMDGTWRVNTTVDDDFIGFVFGYQNSEHFYLFDWKKADQNDPLGFAERGMSVKVVNAGSTLTGNDFWPTNGNGTRVRTLFHNTVPWVSFTDYQFTLQFRNGEIKIVVKQGATVLADITVNDSTYTNGLFGFYNYSQEQVRYSGFRRLSLAQGTYTYDVDATDPDGDAITYSLTTAPPNMTINATTGLISWPVTSRDVGDHTVAIRAQDVHGAFDTQSYTLTILNQNQAPIVSAGPDQTIAVNGSATLNGSVVDDGLPRNATVTSQWSMVSGPGLVTFADASSPATTATFSEAGTYVLRLTATDTALTASDEVIVTVTPPNRAPEVSAGPDLTITLPGIARLNGSVTDDGLPLGSTLTIAWSQVSGPGTATFANAASPITTATFSEAGTYVLRLSAGDSHLTGTDDVIVIVNPPAPNLAPIVDAGATASIDLNANNVQNGGNDEELVNGEIRGWTEAVGTSWTRALSGAGGFPESVNGGHFFYAGETASAELRQDIDVSAFAATIATGTQSFEWKTFVRSRAESTPDSTRVILEYRNAANTAMIARLDSGEVTSTNAWQLLADTRPAPAGTGWIRIRLIATRRTGTTNDAYFDAITFRAVTGAGLKLNGTVADDGLPAGGALTTTWSKVSGPGTVAFANANSAATSATFSQAGTYVLRLTADDSELNSSDELTVTVEAANLAPIANAGADQTITLPAIASLSGSVTDDGKPVGATATSKWTKVSGQGTVTFADAAALNTTATFSIAGTYVLQLTADDTEYTGSDTVTIVVNPVPPNTAPTVNAGADQVIQPPATSAVLTGIVNDDGQPPGSSLTYLWTKISGPGNVSFSSPTALTTTATFSEAGVYILRLTANDSELSGSDDVRITLNGTNKAPTVNAGADQTVAHPTAVNLVGTANDDGLPIDSSLAFSWTRISGPGTVTFGSASALQTSASFSTAGTYVLRLTASDSALSGSDDVTITQTAPPTVSISSPADGATIPARTSIVGSVSDANNWRVEYSLNEEGIAPVWTTLATGTTPVTNAALASFDPTVLMNGVYSIRLVATNTSNQTSTLTITALVEGEQKVGNFSLSFTDLNIPMAGMPIEVTRTYDSRDKRLGDFGIGWTLGVRNVRLQESGNVGDDWQGTVGGGFLPSYCAQPSRPHVVTVTVPNGKVYKFEAVLSPQCSTLFPLRETTISYRPMTGTNATLTPVGDPTAFVAAAFPGPIELLDFGTFDPIDFDEYRLTLPNGEVMLINQQTGLKQWNDANGNSLTVNSNGIIHSSGKSLVFVRDSLGRITQITDPLGNAMIYSYNGSGDLVSFRDRENQTSTFTYNTSHGLLSMVDPRGKQPVRIEYDDQGRVLRQIDANGKIINFSHDTNNRREVTTDRLGNSTVLEYNARGMVVRITDADGNITTRTYDSRDNLISETNASGKTTGFTYDARNNKLSETDALGNVTRYTYNARDQVLTVTDALLRVTTNVYDGNGNLLSVKDPLNQITTYTYTAKGQVLTRTDPLGNVTRFEYDASGNTTKETDALGNATISTYDANNNKLTESVNRTNAAGVVETLVTTYQYDRVGRLVKTTTPDGAFTENVYDSVGRQIATRDQLGRQTSYEYDDLGQPIRITFPDNTKQESTYDAEGRLLTFTDRANRVTTNEYDALGRLVKTTHPDNTFKSKTYDSLGRVTSEKDEKGNTTTFEYDPNCGCTNRRTKVIDAAGNAAIYTFDAVGNQATMKDARGHVTQYEYNGNNRRTRVIHPDNSVEITTYDAAGRMASRTDQAGRVTRFEYDKVGRLLKVIDALQQNTTYTYNEVGNMLTQVDANNRTTRFEYDRAGRRVKRTLPLGMFETLVYDAVGNVTSRTNFKGETTTYEYDAMNRLLRKTPAAALNQPAVVFTYGPSGKRASMTDASGASTYTYDLRDRLTSKTTPGGTLTYTYDAAGNLTSTTSSNQGGLSVNYTADVLNRLSSVTDNHQSGITNYTYDANGNLAGFTSPNGVQSTFTYNTLNRLTNLSIAKTTPLAGYTYQLGTAGNRLSVAELGGRQIAYNYDALYRLTKETVSGDPNASSNGVIDYTYDPTGNRLTRTSTLAVIPATTSTYDANDRLTSETYDADGNLKASAGVTYNYDFEDRLSDVNGGAVSFVYDGDGNRVAKTVGGVTTKYLVDTLNPTGYAQVVEETVGGAVQRVYTFGHDLISQRQLIGGNWSISYFGYDGTGSVRFLTDANGVVTDTYDYDAFGTLVASTGSTPNEYLYVGERFDPNAGFYYLRARYMNPATGRFLTRDPHEGVIFEPSTLHKYLYVANDPVNKIDPSGLFAQLAVAGGMTLPGYGADAAQKIAIGAWIRFLLTALGIGVIAVSAVEIAKRIDRPIRLHHYTDWTGLMYIMKPVGGGINSPSGRNFLSPDLYLLAGSAEERLAVCKELDVRITLDVYVTRDGVNWPPTPVAGVQCSPTAGGGWANRYATGGGREVSTSSSIPFYTRNPQVVPLF